MDTKKLNRIELGGACRVLSIEGSLRAELAEQGITAGAVLTRLFDAPCGDPAAYLVRGAVTALRSKDAERIRVRPL